MKIQSAEKYYFFKGRVALYAILKAMGVGPGDEVILPGFTCVVVANAVKYLKAKPVYVDINKTDYNIDINKIQSKITKKTKVIIAQHSFGIPADMDKINNIAKKHNLYIIEDSAHALGAKYKGREVGFLSDAAFFSTQWSKPITTGLGGFCVINNPEVKEKFEKLYDDFISPNLFEKVVLVLQYIAYKVLFNPASFWILMTIYRKLYSAGIIMGSSNQCELNMDEPERYALKISAFQKRLINKKMKNIDKIINHRKMIGNIYEKGFKGIKAHVLSINKEISPVFLRYPVLVDNKTDLLNRAKKKNIEIGDWFVSPLHPIEEGLIKLNYKKGECPVAEKICEHIINLPTHPGVNKKTAEKILSFVMSKNIGRIL